SQADDSDSGCEADDFTGFPAGSIALIQRGSCTFAQKVRHAEAAGAAAVVIFNEGQSGRRDVVEGMLDEAAMPGIPVVGIAHSPGAAWAEEPVTVRVVVDVTVERVVEHNVIARTPGGDP